MEIYIRKGKTSRVLIGSKGTSVGKKGCLIMQLILVLVYNPLWFISLLFLFMVFTFVPTLSFIKVYTFLLFFSWWLVWVLFSVPYELYLQSLCSLLWGQRNVNIL